MKSCYKNSTVIKLGDQINASGSLTMVANKFTKKGVIKASG